MRARMATTPERYGLYEPDTERDACGIGFVAHIKGEKSRAIVEQSLEILNRLSHRAACGCDPETGDGAGILLQIPHRFFQREAERLGLDLPKRRRYGVGIVFFPADPRQRAACKQTFEDMIRDESGHAEETERILRDWPV